MFWLSQSDIDQVRQIFRSEILLRKKNPPGFSQSRYIIKMEWSPILDSGLQYRERRNLRGKNFAKIQSPIEVQAGMDCHMTPESSLRFYLVSNKQ